MHGWPQIQRLVQPKHLLLFKKTFGRLTSRAENLCGSGDDSNEMNTIHIDKHYLSIHTYRTTEGIYNLESEVYVKLITNHPLD